MLDYVKMYKAPGIRVGLCEIQGRRPSQEDSLQVGIKEIKKFPLLSVDDQEEVLQQTFDQLQNQYGQAQDTGSTCCAVTAWTDPDTNVLHVSTASAGDSAAFLIIIDEAHEGVVQAKRINELHNPDASINATEYDRVAAISIPTRYNNLGPLRLNGELAVSRGFGDRYYEQFGLSHIPEIVTIQKSLSSTQKAFIVLACDGLTEAMSAINARGQSVQKPVLSVNTIANIVNTMRKKRGVDQIAEHLVDSAYVNGSHDNISVAVFEVGIPTSAVICDGHNGVISQNIAENFYPALEKNIQERLVLNSKPELIDEIQLKTASFLGDVTAEIVNEIIKSESLRKLFASKNNIDNNLSRKALAKTLLEDSDESLTKFIAKYKTSTVWKKLGSKKLISLAMQHTYAEKVVKVSQHPDPAKGVDKVRALFKDPNVRHQLEKGHGFWGWLFQKLGWTKGQRMIKFFNAKHKPLKDAELELTRKSRFKK